MHSKILAVAAGTALTFVSFAADALPAGSVAGARTAPQITLVAEGCGPGYVRGPAGGCRLGRAVVVRPVRPVVVVPARPVVVVRPPRAVVVAPRRGGCGIRVPGVAIVTPC